MAYPNTPMGAIPVGAIPAPPFHAAQPQMNAFQGQSFQGDHAMSGALDPYDNNYGNSGAKPKKDKTKKANGKFDQWDHIDPFDQYGGEYRSLVEVKHEGYVIERVEPKYSGEKWSWARTGNMPMQNPHDEKKLLEIIRIHRQKTTRFSPQQDLKQLSENQQQSIERIIDKRNLRERDRHADWILADVQTIGEKGFLGGVREIRKIQIILRRQDRNQVKGREKTKKGTTNVYHASDIIDLNDDQDQYQSQDRGQKQKQKQKQKQGDGWDREWNLNGDWNQDQEKGGKKQKDKGKRAKSMDHIFSGMGLEQLGQPANNHGHQQQFAPMQDNFAQPMHLPPLQIPLPPPPGHGQFGQLPLPPMPMQHHASIPSARRSFSGNPFEPIADLALPLQFDSPMDEFADFQNQHSRAQSAGRLRRTPKRRDSVDSRRVLQLEDTVRDLSYKLDSLGMNSDSSGSYDDDRIFSPRHSEAPDWSPPSSPRSQFSEAGMGRSLERRKTYYGNGRDRRYPGRQSAYRHREIDVIPESSERSRRLPDSRRRSSRPKLVHAATYDDYPGGRAAEPRFLPPPAPRPPMQRRLTDFDDRYDYEDFDDFGRRDSRRRSGAYETYEGASRDMNRGSRRQSYAGGGSYHP